MLQHLPGEFDRLAFHASAANRPESESAGIDQHRGELLTLLIKSGDVRRATISALTPLVAEAVTTDDVLTRALGADDADRFERLAETVERIGSDELAKLVAEFRPMVKRAKGATVGELFGVKD